MEQFNPVAYVADGGKITAKNTKAYGYGSVIAYSKDGGDIAITGNIEAKDEWAATDAATTAEKYKNICVVGDEDQSIYAFRGANINNILNFERDYKNAFVAKLEQNYRSTKTILDTANELIKNNVNS